jgi:hypothetical protein
MGLVRRERGYICISYDGRERDEGRISERDGMDCAMKIKRMGTRKESTGSRDGTGLIAVGNVNALDVVISFLV